MQPIQTNDPTAGRMSTRERLRILIVAPSLPYPPIWGFGIRVNQFLRLLARQHDVSLLTYDELDAIRPFDVIQIESSQLAGFDFSLSSLLILDEHNIEYELLYRMYRTEGSPMRRIYNRLEFAKFKREEIRSWRSVSGCVMTSAREQKIVKKV